jgi:AcrR family transcriptional regulator
MSPRPYDLGQRQLVTDQTRSRIIAAARDLLAAERGTSGFTVDAVARQAGVARMTVYYQFKSKRGVLEALFDDLANRGLMPHLRPVFQESDPVRALDQLIAAFAHFWNSDRVVIRRARALGALDPEIAESIQGRDAMRREHIRKIVDRMFGDGESGKVGNSGTRAKRVRRRPVAEATDVLHMLTSFETFDTLLNAVNSFDLALFLVRKLAATMLSPRPQKIARTPF